MTPLSKIALHLCVISAFTIIAAAARAAPVKVNGIDVTLEPPPGFTHATAFTGFQHVQSFSTIEIRQLEAPFERITGQLTAEIFAAQDLQLIEKQAVPIGDRDAVLLQLESGSSLAPFNKWMLVVGDAYRSLSVTASYPKLAEEELGGPLRQSLLSTQWLRTAQQQLFYDLPFTASETADLKYTRRTANMLVLADTSQTGSLVPLSPSIVIGHLTWETELPDIKTLSHRQLQEMESLEITEVISEGETKVDGIRAYRIRARARSKKGDKPLIFRQLIAVQPLKYLLIQSSVEESLAQRYQPQFEQVVASISFKQAR